LNGATPLVAADDPDADGISNFDEYRGAIVSGKQVRLDPLLKDTFVYMVTANNLPVGTGQCGGTSLLLSGGPSASSPSATLTLTTGAPGDRGFFTAGTAVFSIANVRGEIVGTGGGRARIVALLSSTSVAAEITQPFPANVIAAGAWQLTESLF